MFGSLGMPELIFILVLALLIFGPKRLPQVGRTLGRGLREFRQATNELKKTVETEISSVDVEAPSPTPAAVPVPSAVPHSGGDVVPDPESEAAAPLSDGSVEASGDDPGDEPGSQDTASDPEGGETAATGGSTRPD